MSYFQQRMAEVRDNPSLIRKVRLVAPAGGLGYEQTEPEPCLGRRGYIYFAMAGEHVKIGFATDLHSRIRSLSTGNHMELSLQEHFASYQAAEKLVHKRFQKDRIRGEWFKFSYEIEELWGDIWDYKGCHAHTDGADRPGTEFLSAMDEVFFELATVETLLENIGKS